MLITTRFLSQKHNPPIISLPLEKADRLLLKLKKKVIFICKGHPNIAGAQLYLRLVADVFPSEKFDLHYAFHIGDGTRVFDEIAKSHTIYKWEYDWRHLSFQSSVAKAIKLFKKIAPDLVIFNSSEDKVLGPIWAARLAGIKKRVMIVHWAQSADSLPFLRKKRGFPIPVPSRYSIKTRVLRGLAYRQLTKLIFVNNMTREAYVKLYSVPASRCVTVYNGIDLDIFTKSELVRHEMRQKLGVQADDIVVFAAGNLTEVKGYEYLIKAVHLLKKGGIQLKCFIAGQGELRSRLEAQIKNLGLEGIVQLLGYREDMPSLLAAADIFCMPSLNEALPYSLLEAMAAGLPVVASKVGGIPEVVTDGREGFLVPPGNVCKLAIALESLALDSELRKTMGSYGKKTIQDKFSLDRMLEKTERLLMEHLK